MKYLLIENKAAVPGYYSVAVITRDFDEGQYSRNPGSNPGSTSQFVDPFL